MKNRIKINGTLYEAVNEEVTLKTGSDYLASNAREVADDILKGFNKLDKYLRSRQKRDGIPYEVIDELFDVRNDFFDWLNKPID